MTRKEITRWESPYAGLLFCRRSPWGRRIGVALAALAYAAGWAALAWAISR